MPSSNIYQLAQFGLGVVAMALLVWIVRHVSVVTIPAMLASFERINREQRQEFRDVLEADRQRHLQREQALQKIFTESLDRIETRNSV